MDFLPFGSYIAPLWLWDLTAQNAGIKKAILLYIHVWNDYRLWCNTWEKASVSALNAEETAQLIQDAWISGKVISTLESPTDCFTEILWKMGLPAEIPKTVIWRDTEAHRQYNVTPN